MLDTTTYPIFTVLPSHDERVVFTGRLTPMQGLLDPIKNTGWNKPTGGLWTCPTGSEGWLAWCQQEDFDNPEAMQEYTLQIAQPIQLAVIDTLADLEAILDAHGVPAPYPVFGGDRLIDFESLAREVDGIWLTDRGQWATRMKGMYGWDIESILFFRWVF